MSAHKFLLHCAAACSLVALFATRAAAQVEVILPRPGSALNRIHAQFRWPQLAPVVDRYELQLVEDDGSFNPFVNGFPVTYFDQLSAAEPRTVVKAGMQFGKPYAWRVAAFIGNTRIYSDTYRFSTAALPASVPPIVVTQPPGSPGPSPGLVLFNHTGLNGPNTGGAILVVDSTGQVVYFHDPFPRFGDIRLLPSGRLLWIRPSPVLLGGGGRAFETTLDGGIVWSSPDVTLPSGDDLYSVHHEIFPMPNGDYLALIQDDRTIIIAGQPRDYAGDAIVQFDRHTRGGRSVA